MQTGIQDLASGAFSQLGGRSPSVGLHHLAVPPDFRFRRGRGAIETFALTRVSAAKFPLFRGLVFFPLSKSSKNVPFDSRSKEGPCTETYNLIQQPSSQTVLNHN